MTTLARDFEVVFPGEIHPRALKAGDEVPAEVAAIAAACGVLNDTPAAPAADAPKAARRAPRRQAFSGAPETK